MTECRKYIELISAAVDGELSAADRSALEHHLDICSECRKTMEVFSSISENFPRDTEAPENLLPGTMALIKATAAQPKGLRKFISVYGKYTGLAAALIIVFLGVKTFSTHSTMSSDNCVVGTHQNSVSGEAADSFSLADGTTDAKSSPYTDRASPEDAPESADYDTAGNQKAHFSDTGTVLNIETFYSEHGHNERYYGIYQLSAPVSSELEDILSGSDCICVYTSETERQYSIPLAQLNQLDPADFEEIVFDDLTAEYGLVVIIN